MVEKNKRANDDRVKLTPQRQKDKKARDLICAALREYHAAEPRVPAFTKDRIPHEQYDKELTKEGIEEGIICMHLLNNMSGMSAGDLDIITLLHRYILDKESRDEINRVLKEKRGY